jgi:hypothetical protein
MAQDQQPEHDPLEHLRTFTDEHTGHEDITALENELGQDSPDHGRITDIVDRISGNPDMSTKIQLWWNDPHTQAFISDLNATGL